MGQPSTTLMSLALNTNALNVITQSNGHHVVQGYQLWYQLTAVCDILLVKTGGMHTHERQIVMCSTVTCAKNI